MQNRIINAELPDDVSYALTGHTLQSCQRVDKISLSNTVVQLQLRLVVVEQGFELLWVEPCIRFKRT